MLYLGVDATNWIHQLWHALSGKNVLAMAESRLYAMISSIKPAHVVLCFDRKSFRHELLPTYKAHRQKKVTDLVDLLHAAPSSLAKLGQICQEDGYEADDGLATLADYAWQAGARCVLASPDKDLRQCLVDSHVTILRGFKTNRGELTAFEWYTAQTLHEQYGLTPKQWPDYQALVGDKGDAIDGCPGWGEQTAKATLAKCGTLAAMFRNPFGVPCTNRQRDSLLAFRTRSDLVLKLVTLVKNVPAVYDALR